MIDVLKLIIGAIPRYAINFLEIWRRPHDRIQELVRKDDQHLTSAWTFFAISLSLTELIRFAGRSNGDGFIFALLADSIWKVALFALCVAAIYLALRIVSSRVRILEVLAVSVYFYSFANVGWHLFLFVMNSVKAGLPCERVVEEYGSYRIDCEAATNFSFGSVKVWETLLRISEASVLIIGGLGLIWLAYGWFIWGPMFGLSRKRCAAAFGIFMVFMPVVGTAALVLRFNVLL